MKNLLCFGVLIVLFVMGCTRPEDIIVGTWEYDSYEVDESGIGFLASYLPEDWKTEVDEWIEKTKGLTNSQLIFNRDGTYEESYTGAVKDFTAIKGNFAVPADFTEIRLKHNGKTDVMKLLELEENYFSYQKEFSKYKVPLTLNIYYKRVK